MKLQIKDKDGNVIKTYQCNADGGACVLRSEVPNAVSYQFIDD